MKLDPQKLIKHAGDVINTLDFLAELVLGPAAPAAAKQADAVLEVVAAALHALDESIGGKPIDVEARLAALRLRIADNDSAADAALAEKFDRSENGGDQ